jgi:cytochrome b
LSGQLNPTVATVAAWDAPTRLFHWLLVTLIVAAWASFEFAEALGDERLVWHRWNGLVLLTLIIWRILWGLTGPRSARFSSFVRGPGAVLGYTRDLGRRRARTYLGHNPLGGLMVMALIVLVAAIGSLGLFSVEENDLATGPLYRLAGNEVAKAATGWHRFLFEPVLLILIGLHIAANLIYQFVRKDPLISAMVTGRKPASDFADAPARSAEASPSLLPRALAVLIAAKLILFGGIAALGGRLPPVPQL